MARTLVATVALLCLCTCIISAVLILNPGEGDPANADAVIGMGPLTAAPTEEEAPATPTSTGDERFCVTFTFYDRESITCTTSRRTVGELAALLDVQISDEQLAHLNLEQTIEADAVIAVDEVTYGTDSVSAPIPYTTRYVDVQTIRKGTTKTQQSGKNGTTTTEYQITYVNGVEVLREETQTYTSVQPTECVILRGVGGTLTVGGKTYSYSYYIDCGSTVYTGGGTTASGLPATEKVIAVDPRVIPLGTTCYISGSYCEVGFRTAADTGGGIKGNFIDVYFDASNPYFAGYGRRNVRVYIF